MMNILYIGTDVSQITGGATQINRRNIDLLRSNSIFFKTLSPCDKTGRLKKYLFGIERSFIKQVLEELSSNHYRIVFISQSLYGRIAKYVKKKNPGIVVICFFHNIERQYASELVRVSGIFHLPFYWAACYSERKAVCFSDFLITLNSRDDSELYKLYGRNADLILPTSLQDKYVRSDACLKQADEIVYLFVGVAFFANVEGVTWFINEVMPKISGRLIVIGKGMEKLSEYFSDPRIEIHGYVEDLSCYYSIATFVISPIFSGGGMKTKTAEALMYGKAIIGTKEAFEGYDKCEVMYECNDSSSFVETINRMINTHNYALFYQGSRNLFLQKYSNKASFDSFSEWITSIIK